MITTSGFEDFAVVVIFVGGGLLLLLLIGFALAITGGDE